MEFFMAMVPPTVTHQEKQVHVVNGKPKFYEPAELKAAKHKDGEPMANKPDTDNLQKLLKDCMTKVGFWKDDALVCREIVEKFWADIPGIYIRIKEM